MISKEELREYAKTRKLNLGQAERDYFQNILLFILYENFGKELVFKGGTALNRAYGLERFSEDLDFTLTKKKELKELIQKGLEKFYLDTEIIEKKFPRGIKYVLRIKGPLYIGRRESLCKLQLDFGFRENIILEPKIITLGRLLRELPPFDVIVMSPEEILAEKVRTIMSRTKARDVYDLWFLIGRGTKIDLDLIERKLDYYQAEFSFNKFKKHLDLKKEIWETELTPLIPKVPSFREVKRLILEKFEKVVKRKKWEKK